jgi:hypothetical protein
MKLKKSSPARKYSFSVLLLGKLMISEGCRCSRHYKEMLGSIVYIGGMLHTWWWAWGVVQPACAEPGWRRACDCVRYCLGRPCPAHSPVAGSLCPAVISHVNHALLTNNFGLKYEQSNLS